MYLYIDLCFICWVLVKVPKARKSCSACPWVIDKGSLLNGGMSDNGTENLTVDHSG